MKAAGGNDGARRLEALARRLPVERAALEAAAAAGAAEAREWRTSVAEQAEAVVALGRVGGKRCRYIQDATGSGYFRPTFGARTSGVFGEEAFCRLHPLVEVFAGKFPDEELAGFVKSVFLLDNVFGARGNATCSPAPWSSQLRPLTPLPLSDRRDYGAPGAPTFAKRPLCRGLSLPSSPPRASYCPRLSRPRSLAAPRAPWRRGFSRPLRCSNRRYEGVPRRKR